MLHRVLPGFFLMLLAAAGSFAQQMQKGPVTLAELRGILTRAERSRAMIAPANQELIEAIRDRGVDFVLTPEEEWALQLREASDELIAAIREAVDPAERDRRLKVARQQGLYDAFVNNFNSSDLAGRMNALSAGREFLAEYADDPNVAQIVAYVRRQMPTLERSVQMLQQREEARERERVRALQREVLRTQQQQRRQTPVQTPTQTNTNTNAPRPADGKQPSAPTQPDRKPGS